MKRTRVVAVVLLLAAIAGLGFRLPKLPHQRHHFVHPGFGRPHTPTPPVATGPVFHHGIAITASLDSQLLGFADQVMSRVVIEADPRVVDVSRLKRTVGFFPLTAVGPSRTTRMSKGRLDLISIDTPIACLQPTCLPPQNGHVVRMPAIQVSAPMRHGTGRVDTTAQWPNLSIEGRVTTADLGARPLPFRRDVTPPPVSYSMSPSALADVLDAVAVVLAVGGLALAFWFGVAVVRKRRRRRVLTGLERALALVLDARTRSPADRRKALEHAATLLAERHAELAGSAERLAWSRPDPTPDALGDLVSSAEGQVNGR